MKAWKEIIRCAFDCVAENKPLFFHCAGGADRTGTVACILEAMLGVSQSDIDKDYELTCFATGVSTDSTARRRNESEWSGLIGQIKSLTVGTTFRDKVINWVASLGFTADEINAFRTAMIDGTPNTITLNVGTHAITNTLTGVVNSNDETSIVKYQPYNADITVPEGYVIESVKVTMGGTDVTKAVFKGTPTNLYRAITKNLTNCTLDGKNIVIDGQGYVANLTAEDGFTLEGGTVSITMGGVNIMAYYSDGKIAIPNVTGDIVITAVAVESAPTTEVVPIAWKVGYTCTYSVGSACTESASSSYMISENIPVVQGETYELTKSDGANLISRGKFILVELDSNNIVKATKEIKYDTCGEKYDYTPSSGVSQLKFRGYSSVEAELKKLVLTKL